MAENEVARRCADIMWGRDVASKALGIEIDVDVAGAATATMTVREDMVNGFDICHGGLVCALADTAFAFACNGYGWQTVADSVHVEFLRPSMLGDKLVAVAAEDYRGRRRGFYTVMVRNQNNDRVCLFRGRSMQTETPILDRENDTKNIEKRKKA